MSRATWSALAALCCALLLSGCASTPTERVQRYGFDGFGAPQGGGGGNPTGYSESSGKVNLTDALQVGSATGMTATSDDGDVFAGGSLYNWQWDASSGNWYFYSNAAQSSLVALINGTASTNHGFRTDSTGVLGWTATTGSANGNPDTALKRGAAGQLTVSDPSGGAHARVNLLDAGGTASATLYTDGTGAFVGALEGGAYTYLLAAGVNAWWINGTTLDLAPATAGGAGLGSTASPVADLTLGDGTAQVLLNHDGATDGLLRVSDPNGVAGGRIDLLDAAGNADVYLYESTGYAILGGVNGVAIAPNNTTKLLVGSTVVQPGYAVGTVDLGAAAYPFANLHVAGTPQAAALQIKSASQELTALSGASASTTNLVPAGCRVLYVVARVTTTITGATTWDAGDGSDVDRYGAALALASGTTLDEASATADPESWSASAQDVTLTANGSNFTGGAVRITAFYLDPTPPGS